MAADPSSLAEVCRQFGDLLKGALHPSASPLDVVLGTPAAAAPPAGDGKHRVNLFFFRFEPSGFFPDTLPGDTWLVRMHCLITPFCTDEGGAAGGHDLSVVGEVMRFLHEQPVHRFTVKAQEFYVQSVFCTLALDQLNQLWSTQGDTVYRPSVLCEVSLAPVIPVTPSVPSPRVGAIGMDVRANVRGMFATAAEIGYRVPQVLRATPDTRSEVWTPALCLVADGACLRSLALPLGSAQLAALHPEAWVAGAVGEEVSLHWQTWDAVNGWQPHGAPVPFPIGDATMDPDRIAGATTLPVDLPFTDHPGQMLLYAQRNGNHLPLRSEPVLLTLYEEA